MPYFSKLKRHMMLLKKIGGFLIILMGILLLLGQVNVLAGILNKGEKDEKSNVCWLKPSCH